MSECKSPSHSSSSLEEKDNTDNAEDEAIASFCSVTGADGDSARHFLSATDGQLDLAVSLFLDGGGGGNGSGLSPTSTFKSLNVDKDELFDGAEEETFDTVEDGLLIARDLRRKNSSSNNNNSTSSTRNSASFNDASSSNINSGHHNGNYAGSVRAPIQAKRDVLVEDYYGDEDDSYIDSGIGIGSGASSSSISSSRNTNGHGQLPFTSAYVRDFRTFNNRPNALAASTFSSLFSTFHNTNLNQNSSNSSDAFATSTTHSTTSGGINRNEYVNAFSNTYSDEHPNDNVSNLNSTTSVSAPLNTLTMANSASAQRQQRLADLFRIPSSIIFTPTRFDVARKAAMEKKSWILITIHKDGEFSCQEMLRDIWNDPTVQDFIRESQTVFLFFPLNSPEADRYCQFYPFEDDSVALNSTANFSNPSLFLRGGQSAAIENTDGSASPNGFLKRSAYPHWALIDPRTGKRVLSCVGGDSIAVSEDERRIASKSTSSNSATSPPLGHYSPSAFLQQIAGYILDHPLDSNANSTATNSSSNATIITTATTTTTTTDTTDTSTSANEHALERPCASPPALGKRSLAGNPLTPLETLPALSHRSSSHPSNVLNIIPLPDSNQMNFSKESNGIQDQKFQSYNTPEPDETDPNAFTLLIRLPNGTRLKRRFDSSHPLSSVYHYVADEMQKHKISLEPFELFLYNNSLANQKSQSLHDLALNKATLTVTLMPNSSTTAESANSSAS